MGVYKVGNIWYIDYYCEGRRVREPASKRKAEAEEMLEARKTDIKRGEFRLPGKRKIKFEDYAEEYMEKYSKVNKRAWRRDESALKHLKPHFKGLVLSKITPKHIEDYKRKGLERAKPSTVNRELTVLKSMFSTAERWKYANDNPVKKTKFLQERQYVMRILDKEEIKRLISSSGGHLKSMIILALNTTMRKGEIFNLRWNDVDFAEHYIYIKETKSNIMRKVPMNSMVAATLKEIKRENDLVFPSPRAKKRYSYIHHQFKAACRRAGISDLRFHDLRHTAATLMVMGGIDLVTVKEILGHSSIEMTMRYAHPTPENKRQAVSVLASMFESGQKTESRRTTSHNPAIEAN